MNPIERSVARSAKGMAANNALERPSSLHGTVAGLKHGESVMLNHQAGREGEAVRVSYHERQSYGDSGKKVPGAYTGSFTIEYPGGRTTSHEHGPFAKTDAAARRGASRDSKTLIADRVAKEVSSHLATKAMGFHDRRV